MFARAIFELCLKLLCRIGKREREGGRFDEQKSAKMMVFMGCFMEERVFCAKRDRVKSFDVLSSWLAFKLSATDVEAFFPACLSSPTLN